VNSGLLVVSQHDITPCNTYTSPSCIWPGCRY